MGEPGGPFRSCPPPEALPALTAASASVSPLTSLQGPPASPSPAKVSTRDGGAQITVVCKGGLGLAVARMGGAEKRRARGPRA